jgi:uncharacterized protein
MDDTPPLIQHAEAGPRGAFYVEQGGQRIAELTYSMADRDVVVGHTWVDPAHRGTALASRLVEAVAGWARRENRKIVPVCSYVQSVFDRSPQYHDVWKK